MTIDTFTRAYLECALWSSTDDNGEPLDADYTIDDIAPSTIADAASDCAEFRKMSAGLLTEWTDDQAGHDLWLTRNHHGAGFWDRGLATGDQLTTIAQTMGDVNLYVGDDGLIYS